MNRTVLLISVSLLALASCSTGAESSSDESSIVASDTSTSDAAPSSPVEETTESTPSASASNVPSEEATAEPDVMDAVPEFDYFTWVPLTGELQGVSVRSDGPTPGSEYDHEGASEFTIIFKSDGSTYDLNAFDFEILVDSKAVPIESQSYIWDEWGSMTSEPAPEPLTDNASVFAIADMKDGTTTQVRVYYDGKPLAVFGPNGQPTEGGCTAC